jgi:hypothetical protein
MDRKEPLKNTLEIIKAMQQRTAALTADVKRKQRLAAALDTPWPRTTTVRISAKNNGGVRRKKR